MICNMENFEALLGGTNQSRWPLILLLAHKEPSFEASFEANIPIQAAQLQQEMEIPCKLGVGTLCPTCNTRPFMV